MLHRGGHRLRLARRLVVARDGARCRRCGAPIDVRLGGLDPLGLTLGHIVPVSRGGTDALANLAPEHRACNLAAGAGLDAGELAKPPHFFRSGDVSGRTRRARNGAYLEHLRDDANTADE